MTDTFVWLQNWFRNQSAVVESDPTQLRAVDYFAAGYVDSLGIVTLIRDIENELGVTFTMEAYDDPGFSTVGGLADIVEALRADR
jgi:acyl carrier protein